MSSQTTRQLHETPRFYFVAKSQSAKALCAAGYALRTSTTSAEEPPHWFRRQVTYSWTCYRLWFGLVMHIWMPGVDPKPKLPPGARLGSNASPMPRQVTSQGMGATPLVTGDVHNIAFSKSANQQNTPPISYSRCERFWSTLWLSYLQSVSVTQWGGWVPAGGRL